jgi:hypothetical protein
MVSLITAGMTDNTSSVDTDKPAMAVKAMVLQSSVPLAGATANGAIPAMVVKVVRTTGRVRSRTASGIASAAF